MICYLRLWWCSVASKCLMKCLLEISWCRSKKIGGWTKGVVFWPFLYYIIHWAYIWVLNLSVGDVVWYYFKYLRSLMSCSCFSCTSLITSILKVFCFHRVAHGGLHWMYYIVAIATYTQHQNNTQIDLIILMFIWVFFQISLISFVIAWML